MKRGMYILLILTITAGALPACREKVMPGVREVKREQVTGVTVEVISPKEVIEYLETSGTVSAKATSVVASRMMGTVMSLRVKEGDRVAAGQVLLTIDDRDVAERVKAAEKALEGAKQQQSLSEITYQRYQKLYDEKALAGQELDQIGTQKKVADLEYERAKAMLAEVRVYQGFSTITSPVSGVITEKKIEEGSMAVPGMPLLLVEDNASYRIEVNADEKMAGRVKTGMDVSVFIEALNRELAGKVTEVVPSVNSATRSFLVKISLKDKDLKNGYYARVAIPVGEKTVLLIPKKSVIERGQLSGVYTVERNSVITYRLVRVGKPYGDSVEILSGLNPGDTVIVGGVEKAIDGGKLISKQ